MGVNKEDFFAPLGETFWADLRPTVECYDFLSMLEHAFGADNVCILTAPIATKGCADGKIAWLWRWLPEYARSRRYLIGAAKEFCAGPGSLLVDDSDSNISKFVARGGAGILVPRPWNSRHSESVYAHGVVRREIEALELSNTGEYAQ